MQSSTYMKLYPEKLTLLLVGSLATLIAVYLMYRLRNIRIWKLPVLGLLMPALTNALLVGWELTVYIGGGFWLNALYVAIGEAAVLLIPGSILYTVIRQRQLDRFL